jgi:ATP-dependent Clp protease ATP-binding subunit ClpB
VSIEDVGVEDIGVRLDLERRSPRAREFEERLRERVIGQSEALHLLSGLYQTFLASMNPPTRPIGTMLFLGPTGSGKTRVAEAAAEVLFGDARSLIKIDCGEFQQGHDIAKLIGSPPGYVGHRETLPLLTQENLDRHHTPATRLSIVLFDEIEKASEALWQLLLGILDNARLTLGDNRLVDFSHTLIIMTSNLGAQEMSEIVSVRVGFAPPQTSEHWDEGQWKQALQTTALAAARRRFSPEFMNRIDKTVVFEPLREHHLRAILDLELQGVQDRILRSRGVKFRCECTSAAKDFLLDAGTDPRYGARHLKRAIEQLLVFPLSSLVATDQVRSNDVVIADHDPIRKGLEFSKRPGRPLVATPAAAPARMTEDATTRMAMATTIAVAMTIEVVKALRQQHH